MGNKCPDQTLRMRGVNLNLYILSMFEDTVLLGAARIIQILIYIILNFKRRENVPQTSDTSRTAYTFCRKESRPLPHGISSPTIFGNDLTVKVVLLVGCSRPANIQRCNNVVTMSQQRRDVAATL